MSNARSRSPFGKFQMHESHLVTPPDVEAPLPRVSEMARLLREGQTLEEVAEMCDRSVSTIRSKLSNAGYRSSGKPK